MLRARAESWKHAGPEVMELEGRIDSGTAVYVGEDILLCIGSGARQMLLDCSDVSYMSAAGLRTIMAVARTMKKTDGDIAVCGLQPQVKQIFTICGIHNFIPVFSDQSEAIAAFTG